MAILVERATRKQGKLRLAIDGPSGSGKTYSALVLAFGIGSKVLIADTENRSAIRYAEMEDGELQGKLFDISYIDPPYTISKYTEVIDYAEKNGYDVLILDSISHAWAGEGGLLQKKEALDSRGGRQNGYTNWAAITKEQESFRARLLGCKVHLICTMRSKQEYAQEEEGGKKTIKKLGMAPIQRDGMEYEFDVLLSMAMDHTALASKHRTGSLLEGKIFKPTIKDGTMLRDWLTKGAPAPTPAPAPAQPAPAPLSDAQAEKIMGLIAGLQALTEQSDEAISKAIRDRILKVHKREIKGVADLTYAEGETLIASLGNWIKVTAQKKIDEAAGKVKTPEAEKTAKPEPKAEEGK